MKISSVQNLLLNLFLTTPISEGPSFTHFSVWCGVCVFDHLFVYMSHAPPLQTTVCSMYVFYRYICVCVCIFDNCNLNQEMYRAKHNTEERKEEKELFLFPHTHQEIPSNN